VARAVEFVFLFTLAGGLLVLQAAIASTQDERNSTRRSCARSARRSGNCRARRPPSSCCSARSPDCSARGCHRHRLGARRARLQHPLLRQPLVWAVRDRRRRARRDARGWLGTRSTVSEPPLTVLRQLA
jgi:putative ABC transport system permease protein